MEYSRGENVRNPDVVVRAENIATDVLFGLSVIPELSRHVVEEEHIIRGNDPSFRPATTEKKEFLLAKENTEGDGMGGGNEGGGRRRCMFRVDGGVVATGAQAKKEHESSG